ncbi:Ku protein, partial [Cytobacillus oceanisediminis]
MGIGKMMMRGKEELGVIRVYDNRLVMERMDFGDEVRKRVEVGKVR